jgi:hypothetical protein
MISYETIAIALALLIATLGVFVEIVRGQVKLRGYQDIARDVQGIVHGISGEVDRDGHDLLVRGSMRSWPVLIRFSRAEHEPGVHMTMPVPSNVSLYCVPVKHEGETGRVSLKTADERFDARFKLTTNSSAVEAKLLIANPSTLSEIQKLCGPSQALLSLEGQTLDVTEMVIPEEDLSQRVLGSVMSMTKIAGAAMKMPGTKAESIPPVPHRRNWLRTAYIGIPIVLLVFVFVRARLKHSAPKPAEVSSVPAGLDSQDASRIGNLKPWRLAQAAEFNPDASAWLQQQGQEPKAQVSGDFNGTGQRESAYVLKSVSPETSNPVRLVMLVNGEVRFDAEMPRIDAVAVLPKDKVLSIEWRGRGPAGPPNGDALLVVQRYNDPSSALVVFASGAQLLTGNPKNFSTLTLR